MFITCGVCEAQFNLVPNPSFEVYDTCPNNLGQLNRAIPWFRPSTGSSDLFNSCSMPWSMHVPSNYFGYQYARNGNGYAGFYTYYWNAIPQSYKEYIAVQLTSPLTAGVTYYVNFYVSLADSANFASDDIGAYFSNGSITSTNYYPLPVVPQVMNPSGNIISDKLNWTKISGYYVAAGGENYITIGNFNYDINTDTVFVGGGLMYAAWEGDYKSSYYYIDDVCVASDSMDCLIPSGFEDLGQIRNILILPNPFEDKINITAKRNELIEFVLYDVIGRKTLNKSFTNSTSINTEQLAKGIYLYEVRNKNGIFKTGKVVKQ